MIKDLVEGDGARKQLVLQDSLITEKNKQISAKDSIVNVYRKKDIAYQSTFSEYATIDSLNQRSIESLKFKVAKYKRQRNAFRIFVGVLLIGLAIK